MSYDSFYGKEWPTEAKPYLHLGPYFRCWLSPESLFRNKRVLDFGAGECIYTRFIAEMLQPKEIIACELFSKRMLPTVRVCQNPRLKFVVGDCLKLPFKKDSFDLVWGSGILSDLRSSVQALLEVRRVLKENGLYVGWEPNPFNAVILFRFLFNEHSPNHHLLWPWRLRNSFRQTGFQVTMRYFYGQIPSIGNRFLGTCTGIIAERID